MDSDSLDPNATIGPELNTPKPLPQFDPSVHAGPPDENGFQKITSDFLNAHSKPVPLPIVSGNEQSNGAGLMGQGQPGLIGQAFNQQAGQKAQGLIGSLLGMI